MSYPAGAWLRVPGALFPQGDNLDRGLISERPEGPARKHDSSTPRYGTQEPWLPGESTAAACVTGTGLGLGGGAAGR